MPFPKHINQLLVVAEEQYPKYLAHLGLPDHPAVKLGYYLMMAAGAESDPLDDSADQAMIAACFEHELSRLANIVAELTEDMPN